MVHVGRKLNPRFILGRSLRARRSATSLKIQVDFCIERANSKACDGDAIAISCAADDEGIAPAARIAAAFNKLLSTSFVNHFAPEMPISIAPTSAANDSPESMFGRILVGDVLINIVELSGPYKPQDIVAPAPPMSTFPMIPGRMMVTVPSINSFFGIGDPFSVIRAFMTPPIPPAIKTTKSVRIKESILASTLKHQ